MAITCVDSGCKLYTCAQISAIESHAEQAHALSASKLMSRAGRGGFNFMRQRYPDAKSIVVCCGGGNNGGDGWVLATLALQAGLNVQVLSAKDPNNLKHAAADAYAYAQRTGLKSIALSEIDWSHVDVIIDALLGTGLSHDNKLKGVYVEWLPLLNAMKIPILCLDVPSGVDADTGSAAAFAVRGDATLTFIAPKLGLMTAKGRYCCGDLYCDDLSLPINALESTAITARIIKPITLAKRADVIHKGVCGHVLIVGGNEGYGGAALLAGLAASRAGAGLVSIATVPMYANAMLAAAPELMVRGLTSLSALEDMLQRASVVVAGPGLGRDAWGQQMIHLLLSTSLPLVIDADALWCLAQAYTADALVDYPAKDRHWFLTPHLGEAAQLLAIDTSAVDKNRFVAARNIAKRYQAMTVLKGNGTIIAPAEQDKPYRLCNKGNAGMATAGSGDVLSGMLGGLLAQEDIYADLPMPKRYLECISLGVYAHSLAADLAVTTTGERSLMASDIISHIPEAMCALTARPADRHDSSATDTAMRL